MVPIWEWIGRDLLPMMARDYNEQMKLLIAAKKARDLQQAAAIFQFKVAKSVQGNLSSAEGAERARSRLAFYTASPSAYGDLVKMTGALRASEALARFGAALPENILKFDDRQVSKITALLDSFRKKDPDAVPFALALVAGRLKTPRELMLIATKAARGRNAVDIAATSYAIAISMVLDQMDDKRIALRIALKKNRVTIARDVLADIDRTEAALRVGIRELDASEWGTRLGEIRNAISALVEAEVSRFPDQLGHILKPHNAHGNGFLADMVWKGRDAIGDGIVFCKRLIGQA